MSLSFALPLLSFAFPLPSFAILYFTFSILYFAFAILFLPFTISSYPLSFFVAHAAPLLSINVLVADHLMLGQAVISISETTVSKR